MKFAQYCPICQETKDKSQIMCNIHPKVLTIKIVNYDDGKGWHNL